MVGARITGVDTSRFRGIDYLLTPAVWRAWHRQHPTCRLPASVAHIVVVHLALTPVDGPAGRESFRATDDGSGNLRVSGPGLSSYDLTELRRVIGGDAAVAAADDDDGDTWLGKPIGIQVTWAGPTSTTYPSRPWAGSRTPHGRSGVGRSRRAS